MITRRNKLHKKVLLDEKEQRELDELYKIVGYPDNRKPWGHGKSHLRGLYGQGGLK